MTNAHRYLEQTVEIDCPNCDDSLPVMPMPGGATALCNVCGIRWQHKLSDPPATWVNARYLADDHST